MNVSEIRSIVAGWGRSNPAPTSQRAEGATGARRSNDSLDEGLCRRLRQAGVSARDLLGNVQRSRLVGMGSRYGAFSVKQPAVADLLLRVARTVPVWKYRMSRLSLQDQNVGHAWQTARDVPLTLGTVEANGLSPIQIQRRVQGFPCHDFFLRDERGFELGQEVHRHTDRSFNQWRDALPKPEADALDQYAAAQLEYLDALAGLPPAAYQRVGEVFRQAYALGVQLDIDHASNVLLDLASPQKKFGLVDAADPDEAPSRRPMAMEQFVSALVLGEALTPCFDKLSATSRLFPERSRRDSYERSLDRVIKFSLDADRNGELRRRGDQRAGDDLRLRV